MKTIPKPNNNNPPLKLVIILHKNKTAFAQANVV